MCLRESSDGANPFISAKAIQLTPKLCHIITLYPNRNQGQVLFSWGECPAEGKMFGHVYTDVGRSVTYSSITRIHVHNARIRC